MTIGEDIAFNDELILMMQDALKDLYSTGGVKKIKKDNFYAEYITPTQILNDIKSLQSTNYFLANGCKRKC